MSTKQKTKIENVLQPGKTYTVDAAKYEAMKTAFLAVMPKSLPGMTPLDVSREVRPLLPQELFPGGEKAGWWVKAVQLDLEAKGVITRASKAPVRLWKT
jgi:hypothetical protein